LHKGPLKMSRVKIEKNQLIHFFQKSELIEFFQKNELIEFFYNSKTIPKKAKNLAHFLNDKNRQPQSDDLHNHE